MHNCSDDVFAYHRDEVNLPMDERKSMRERRDTNRTRLKDGLAEKKRPAYRETVSQGSYAMKTMVQHPDNDYDIDDGVYFDTPDLVGPRGGAMTALEARQMVRDAVDDGGFKRAPEVRKNCVRVYYEAGYHVDLPVYRRTVTPSYFGPDKVSYELAGSDWKVSDARDVTDWFEKENKQQSPKAAKGGRQLRRVTREIKKFARSRESWIDPILGGFGITKLVVDHFRPDANREDKALYDTMKAIRDHLNLSLVVQHPIPNNDPITKGDDDPRARFLRERLSEAVEWLAPLFRHDCEREEALKSWDKVFKTTFFSDRLSKDEKQDSARASSVLSSGLFRSESVSAPPVRKDGGGRYA